MLKLPVLFVVDPHYFDVSSLEATNLTIDCLSSILKAYVLLHLRKSARHRFPLAWTENHGDGHLGHAGTIPPCPTPEPDGQHH